VRRKKWKFKFEYLPLKKLTEAEDVVKNERLVVNGLQSLSWQRLRDERGS
jgi:hypothetical protein